MTMKATIKKITLLLAIASVLLPRAIPFSTRSIVPHVTFRPSSSFRAPARRSARPSRGRVQLNLVMDPTDVLTAAEFSQEWIANGLSDALASSSSLLSFTDQGQNLAGIFFQASLLPYLLFLYFLSFRANRISGMGNFGFQFVLLFVLSTIPSGIITKSVYGQSLANTDWLHGSAELLLTMANVFIVSFLPCVSVFVMRSLNCSCSRKLYDVGSHTNNTTFSGSRVYPSHDQSQATRTES